ncbi:hypothetical protein D3C72_2137810 [compost metagenome]
MCGDEPEGWKMNGDSVETRRFCFERYCAISLALASAPRARLFNITVRVYFVLVRSTVLKSVVSQFGAKGATWWPLERSARSSW